MVREDRNWVTGAGVSCVDILVLLLENSWMHKRQYKETADLRCGLSAGELLRIRWSWKKTFFVDSSDTRRRNRCELGETMALPQWQSDAWRLTWRPELLSWFVSCSSDYTRVRIAIVVTGCGCVVTAVTDGCLPGVCRHFENWLIDNVLSLYPTIASLFLTESGW